MENRPAAPKPRTAQEPDRIAQQIATQSLRSQSDSQLEWLGAWREGARWHLPVLDEVLQVELETGEVYREDQEAVRSGWRILVLHYIDVRAQPETREPETTFASFPSARTYTTVYQARVNGRLCATVGRDLDSLRTATSAIGAQQISGGDLAVQVDVFPRIPVRLVWYAGDDELPPASTLLLPANIDLFLCTEDIVVLSESFVARLCGKPF